MVAVHPETQIVWSMLSCVTAGLTTPGVLVLSGKSRANAEAVRRAIASSSERFLTTMIPSLNGIRKNCDPRKERGKGQGYTTTGTIRSYLTPITDLYTVIL